MTPSETSQAGDPLHPPDPDGMVQAPDLSTSPPQDDDKVVDLVAELSIAGHDADIWT